MASRADIKAGRAFIDLVLRDNALLKGLRNAKQQLKNFGADVTALGRTMATMSFAAALPFAFATKIFADFDDKMREVKAVSQSNEEQFAKLTAKAKALGASTSFTAVQVASLMGELGRAGFTADQIEDMTGAVLDLARATSTDATLASGIMAASIRQFGLAADDATRVADALTIAANKSFNTVEMLGEALSYAGPVAADFNMSIEDTLAILGALGNVGIQGSNAGTAVRRLLTLTGAEAEKLKGIFGVTFLDAAGNARPLVDVLDEVNEATKNLGTGARAAKFNEAFGLLGITGASAIAKNAVGVRELQEALKGAEGTAAKTAAEMDAGIGGAFRILLSAVEGVAIAIGETLSEEVTKAAKGFTEFASNLITVIKNNKALIVTVAKAILVVGGIGAALVVVGTAATFASTVLGGLLSVVAAAHAIFSGLAAAVGFVLSPMGLLVAALAAGAYYWANFTESGQKSIAALKSMAASVVGALLPMVETVKRTFGGIIKALKAGNVEGAWKIAIDGMVLAWAQLQVELHRRFGATIVVLQQMWEAVTGFFRAAWEATVGFVLMAWDGFVKFFAATAGEMDGSMSSFTKGWLDDWAGFTGELQIAWIEVIAAIEDGLNGLNAFFENMVRGWQASLLEWAQKNRELTKTILTYTPGMGAKAAEQFDQLLGKSIGSGINREPVQVQPGLTPERQQQIDDIRKGVADKRAEREAKAVTGLAEAEERLAKARAAFEASLADANPGEDESFRLTIKDLEKQVAVARGEAPKAAIAATESFGTFSGSTAALQAGVGNIAADQTAKNTAQMLREYRREREVISRLLDKVTAMGLMRT